MLLDVAAGLASHAGMQVLRARGVEFEASMSFAGLNQALLPIFGQFSELTETHRNALNVALGLGEGDPPDRLVVANAVLTLLRTASVHRPLLVIVDDLTWLDRPTAGVLGFAARRVAESRVGVLAACRPEDQSFFDRVGLPELDLRPLNHDAASNLLESRFPILAPAVRERILTEAQGNPLALLELPAALSDAQRIAIHALPDALPLSRRLETLFASRITALPAPSRQLLLLMALDGTGELRLLNTTVPGGAWLEHLAMIEQARLVYVDEITRRPIFRHPLIRSAVVELATTAERREIHQQLAEVWADQPDRRAWHLAHATVGVDPEVAESLEQAAYHTLRRGDGVGAIAALTRAAELSPRGADRGRRLAEAAYIGADVTGQLRNAAQLLADAHQADPQFKDSVQSAVTAAFVLLNGEGDVDTAHSLLAGAIQNDQQVSPALLVEALNVLNLICFFGGREELWWPFFEALDRLRPGVPTDLDLLSKTFADPVRTAAPALGQLETAISELTSEVDPTRIVRVAIAAVYVDRLQGCRPALWRLVSDGRRGGAVASAIQGLLMLGLDDLMTGQWQEALRLLAEGVGLCETHGYELFAWPGRYQLAALAALTGDYATTHAMADDMMRWAIPRRVGAVQAYACHARALAALGQGNFEEAFRQAATISPPGRLASYSPGAIWALMDLVESATRTGRHADASAHVAAMREMNVADLSSRVALLAGGSAAIAAPDDSAVELFAKTLAMAGAGRWPFDLARVRLVYGERLRRLRANTESRIQLSAALETFECLGAQPWAKRASNELRATGETKSRGGHYASPALTPQEHQIATLAAAGLSNKQIAEHLFLSHRTVGGHLHRLFPKLGVATRAGLRDALATLPSDTAKQTD
jgi:DNA-binding CsgD family transcriptional regulator/tetratricopeptide (TPR) repeat protein